MAIGNHPHDALISDLRTDLTAIKPDTSIRTCNAKLPSTLSKKQHPKVGIHIVLDRSGSPFADIEYARPEHSFGDTP